MRFPNWFGSIHFLFSKKHRRIHAWQKHLCSRKTQQQDQRIVESLEQRRLLAFDLAAAYVIDSEQFTFGTEPVGTQHLIQESPHQITLQFTPNKVVDPSSLASGISIVRSGGIQPDGSTDPFTVDASAEKPSRYADVHVEPGAVLVDDLPTQNQVVIRFADRLPDDLYRITLSSDVDSETGAITGLKTLGTASSPGVEAFSRDGANTFSFDIRIDTGPQVIGVVPQPITRNNLSLSQATNQIVVYFDQAEVLDSGSAEEESFYRLFEVNSNSGDDVGSVIVPAQVEYSSSDHTATLTFSAALAADKLFRLEVGEQTQSIEISQVAVNEIVIEESPLPAPEIYPFNITFNPLLTPRPSYINTSSPTFAGTGRAGATVTLVVDDDNNGVPETVLVPAVVGNNDQWSITPAAPLNGGAEGRVSFFAFQTDSLGRVSPTLSSHVDIDFTAPTQPQIDLLPAQKTQTPT
ncbi:Ig-like domain-containing protein, partial [Pirellulales bacterium]|nr:Ig-like domain-containing protein [Pirellulales bacterium]